MWCALSQLPRLSVSTLSSPPHHQPRVLPPYCNCDPATLQPCLCHIDTSTIHSLPPELLQKVWSFLPLFDLLRCQRVCKGWNTYLPRDDQVLHRAMFSPTTVATSPDMASWDVYIDFRQHHKVQMGALPRLVSASKSQAPL